MQKKNIFIWIGISLIVILCLAAVIMSYLAFEARGHIQQVIVKTEQPEYKLFIPVLPEELDFCGEKVPLSDIDVRERVERELLVNTYWSSATVLILKRANRWFPVIEPILKQYGIPDDFKYMAVIESGLTNVVSPAGAAGFWQFMDAAGNKYGLEITKEIDERYNVEKATVAACKYLLDSFSRYNNWTLAAASYNHGLNGVDRQINRQKTKDYYNLYLNPETFRFIARIVAMKEIMQNPKKYGFDIEPENLYQPIETKEIKVTTGISDLVDFALKHEVNYKIIKLLNPWLRDNSLPNRNGKTYYIKIPVNKDFSYSLE